MSLSKTNLEKRLSKCNPWDAVLGASRTANFCDLLTFDLVRIRLVGKTVARTYTRLNYTRRVTSS
jgi:hypothetical protein